MDKETRSKIGDRISDCINWQSFTNKEMEEICEEIDKIIKIDELLCEHELKCKDIECQARVEMVFKEVEEHFRETGYKSEEEYNWWQALKKREGIVQD